MHVLHRVGHAALDLGEDLVGGVAALGDVAGDLPLAAERLVGVDEDPEVEDLALGREVEGVEAHDADEVGRSQEDGIGEAPDVVIVVALAHLVAAPQRLAVLPNVPTFKEVGLEPVNRMAYYGIYGPKGLSKEVVDKVNAAVKATVALPDVKKRIEDTGSLIIANSPAEFQAQIQAEFEVYKKVVAAQKLSLD